MLFFGPNNLDRYDKKGDAVIACRKVDDFVVALVQKFRLVGFKVVVLHTEGRPEDLGLTTEDGKISFIKTEWQMFH